MDACGYALAHQMEPWYVRHERGIGMYHALGPFSLTASIIPSHTFALADRLLPRNSRARCIRGVLLNMQISVQ